MSTIQIYLSNLLNLTAPMSEVGRRKKLLDFIVWTLEIMTVLGLIAIVIYIKSGGTSNPSVPYFLIGAPFLILIFTIILIINRYQPGYLASILLLIVTFLTCLLDTPFEVVNGRSIFYFSIPIVLSSLLIQPWASFLVAGLSSLVNVFYLILIPGIEFNPIALIGFFVLALITWVATSNLENVIRYLGQTNNALRISEERYRTLVEISPDMIVVRNMEGAIEMVNQACVETMGYEPSEIIGKNTLEFITPLDHERAKGMYHQTIAEAGSVPGTELLVKRKDGSTIYVEIKSALIKDPVTDAPWKVIGVGRDISLRKQAELQLQEEKNKLEDTVRESEAAYQSLVENSNQGLFLFQGNRIIKANQAFADLTNMPLTELYNIKSEQLSLLIHPDDRETTVSYVQGVVTGQPMSRWEARLLLENGQIRWVEFTPARITFMGQPAVQITAIDLTERKQAELALAQSEERYRVLAEAAQDMIFIVDKLGRVKYTNRYAAGLFGKNSEELNGMPLTQLFPPAVYERQWHSIQEVFETGKLLYKEAISIFPRGKVWLSTWLVPLKDPVDGTDSVLGISRNINHIKEMELSLREAKESLETRVTERTAELKASREELRELAHQTVTIQEEERRWVSRELHDEAGQILIGLKYRLGEALSTLPPRHEEAFQRITAAMNGVDQAMAKIRTLAHDLRPPTLDVAGINLSLQSYCREFAEQTSLTVKYKGVDLPGLADEISISLYRILQEGLTNVVKHAAQATRVQVSLTCTKSVLTLSISDNGSGFHPEPGQKGIGILGMQERLALLGGHLQILSNARQGMRLKAIIPLPVEKA